MGVGYCVLGVGCWVLGVGCRVSGSGERTAKGEGARVAIARSLADRPLRESGCAPAAKLAPECSPAYQLPLAPPAVCGCVHAWLCVCVYARTVRMHACPLSAAAMAPPAAQVSLPSRLSQATLSPRGDARGEPVLALDVAPLTAVGATGLRAIEAGLVSAAATCRARSARIKLVCTGSNWCTGCMPIRGCMHCIGLGKRPVRLK